MKIKRTHKLILPVFFSITPFILMSVEGKKFEDFYDSQSERDLEKNQKKETLIKQLSEKYILIFFYFGNEWSSECAAEYMQKLAEKYNWLLYAISLDGIFIEGFENNKVDNGIYNEFRKKSPYPNTKGPTLFLFNPQNNDIRWIVTASAEFNELENLIYSKYQYFGL